MKNLSIYLSLILALACPHVSSAGAADDEDSLNYPKAAPAITLDPAAVGLTPKGDEAESVHLLQLAREDGSQFPAFLMVTLPKEKTLQIDLNNYVHAMVDSMKLEGAKFETGSKLEISFENTTQTVSGKSKDGVDLTVLAVCFRVKDMSYIVVAIQPPDLLPDGKTTLTDLIETVEPVE